MGAGYDTWLEEPFQRQCHDEDLDEAEEMDCEAETEGEDDDE